MVRKVGSFKDQLAELSNVAPGVFAAANLDPEADEDAYDAVRNERDESEEDLEDEARNHARHDYASMDPSKLRKRANHLEGLDDIQMKKYQGVTSIRKEMMSDEDEDASEDGSQEIFGGGEFDSEEDAEEKSEKEEDPDTGMQMDEEGEEDIYARPVKKSSVRFEEPSNDVSESQLNAAQTDAQLLQDLRKRNREDADKGRDARKQMNLWSKLLGIRIRGQKVVRGAGRIPTKVIKDNLPRLEKTDREAYESTLSALDDMSSHLFLVQQQILASFSNVDSKEGAIVSAGLDSLGTQLDQVSKSSKRIHKEVEQDDEHLDILFKLDKVIFEPLWGEILARWTSRTSVASLGNGQKNKFESSLKAMNQSAQDQIDRGLTGDTFDRLRKRTRVWRGTENENRIMEEQTPKDPEEVQDDEEGGQREESDIFDDSDFYGAMLRELIDSRGGSSLTGTETSDSSLAWAQAAKRAAKKNKNSDLKSSKGRKLRYDVMEKVEHFMPPIPRETWTKEQMDRLFRQLKQSSQATNDSDSKDESDITEQERVELAGLRLFG